MRFSQGHTSVEMTEAFDNKTVRFILTCPPDSRIGYVDFDQRRLEELRKWINYQLRTIRGTQNTKQSKVK